ncbi:MAG TPA: hypothetical protein GXX40_08645 [Firmicutes bacterium]|nr:hypothetical protein [Bacillota bacterium]
MSSVVDLLIDLPVPREKRDKIRKAMIEADDLLYYDSAENPEQYEKMFETCKALFVLATKYGVKRAPLLLAFVLNVAIDASADGLEAPWANEK